jgi:hypothetical protein
MYSTTIRPQSVTLFQRDGGQRTFATLKEYLQLVGLLWSYTNVANEFRTYSHTEWCTKEGIKQYKADEVDEPVYAKSFYTEALYILRDERGQPVTHDALYGAAVRMRGSSSARKVVPGWNGTGPVPNTGRSRNRQRGCKGVRFIRTARGAQFFKEEGEIAVRNRSVLEMGMYDDYYNKDFRGSRSWKDHRGTQWR